MRWTRRRRRRRWGWDSCHVRQLGVAVVVVQRVSADLVTDVASADAALLRRSLLVHVCAYAGAYACACAGAGAGTGPGFDSGTSTRAARVGILRRLSRTEVTPPDPREGAFHVPGCTFASASGEDRESLCRKEYKGHFFLFLFRFFFFSRSPFSSSLPLSRFLVFFSSFLTSLAAESDGGRMTDGGIRGWECVVEVYASW